MHWREPESLLKILLKSSFFVSPPLHLYSPTCHYIFALALSFLSFELGLETMQALPIDLLFQFGHEPPDKMHEIMTKFQP